MGTAFRRRLIWIPVVHTYADLGSMSERVRKLHVQKKGLQEWEQHVKLVEQMWGDIRKEIEELHLDYAGVRLYQDGLPNCEPAMDIVKDMAGTGSPNHRLLLDLIERGATLVGTESLEMLLEEYHLAQQILAATETGEAGALGKRWAEASKGILERRDRYIAQRIAETLKPGETGLIFLGGLHSLEGRLPADVEVIRKT